MPALAKSVATHVKSESCFTWPMINLFIQFHAKLFLMCVVFIVPLFCSGVQSFVWDRHTIGVVPSTAVAALHHHLSVVWCPADTVILHLNCGPFRLCLYVFVWKNGAFLFCKALYSLCLMFFSWNWHSSSLTPTPKTDAKANAKSLQLRVDCCICSAAIFYITTALFCLKWNGWLMEVT